LTNIKKHKILTIFITLIWLINGLVCKVFHLVPRHFQIVERILGTPYAKGTTILIGISEVVMAIWIFSGFKSKINAITQILVIAAMNVLEFILAPDLLLWGPFNALFALILIMAIYYNEFVLNKALNKKSQ
jgi:hypothetical protein